MKNDKKTLQKDHTEKKAFGYVKGNVSINFNLRTDIKQEMKDARDILVEAIKDFDKELEKL